MYFENNQNSDNKKSWCPITASPTGDFNAHQVTTYRLVSMQDH